jgi:hypothetical protein
MARTTSTDEDKIFGNIDPNPGHARPSARFRDHDKKTWNRWVGSQEGDSHSGSRDVTEGVTGGTGTETGDSATASGLAPRVAISATGRKSTNRNRLRAQGLSLGRMSLEP